MQNGVSQAVKLVGGRRELGVMLDPPVSSQAVQQWEKRGWVPPARAKEMSEKFGIPLRMLLKPALADVLTDDDGDDLI